MNYCPHCGKAIHTLPDKSYIEWFLFGVFLPYIGIILYFWFNQTNKKAAKRLLQGSLGAFAFIILGFSVIILYALLVGVSSR